MFAKPEVMPMADLVASVSTVSLTPETLGTMAEGVAKLTYLKKNPDVTNLVVAYFGALKLVEAQQTNNTVDFDDWAKATMFHKPPEGQVITLPLLLGRWEVLAVLSRLRPEWMARLNDKGQPPALWQPVPNSHYRVLQRLFEVMDKHLWNPQWPQLLDLMSDVLAAWTSFFTCEVGPTFSQPSTTEQGFMQDILLKACTFDADAAADWFFQVSHPWHERPHLGSLPNPAEFWLEHDAEKGDWKITAGPLFQVLEQWSDNNAAGSRTEAETSFHASHAVVLSGLKPLSDTMAPGPALRKLLQTVAVFRMYLSQLSNPDPIMPVFPHAWVRAALEAGTATAAAIEQQNAWLLVDAAVALVCLQILAEHLHVDITELNTTQALLFTAVIQPFVAQADPGTRQQLQATLPVYLAQAPKDLNVVPLIRCLLSKAETTRPELVDTKSVMGPDQVSHLVNNLDELRAIPPITVPDLRTGPMMLWPLRIPDCPLETAIRTHGARALFKLSPSEPLDAPKVRRESRAPAVRMAASTRALPTPMPQKTAPAPGERSAASSAASSTAGSAASSAAGSGAACGAGSGAGSAAASACSDLVALEAQVRGMNPCLALATLRAAVQEVLPTGDLAAALLSIETYIGAARQWEQVPLATADLKPLTMYQVSGYEPNNRLTIPAFHWLSTLCPNTADTYRRSATALPHIAKLMEEELKATGKVLEINVNLAKPSFEGKGSGGGSRFPYPYELWRAVSSLVKARDTGEKLTEGQEAFLRGVEAAPGTAGPGAAYTQGLTLTQAVWGHMTEPQQEEYVRQHLGEVPESKARFVEHKIVQAVGPGHIASVEEIWERLPLDERRDREKVDGAGAKKKFVVDTIMAAATAQELAAAKAEWEAMEPQEKNAVAATLLAAKIADECAGAEAKGMFVSDLNQIQARVVCVAEGTAAQGYKAFAAHSQSQPSFKAEVELYTKCESFGDANYLVLERVIGLMMAKLVDDNSGTKAITVKTNIVEVPEQMVSLVNLVGKFMLLFPDGKPTTAQVSLWRAREPELRVKAVATAETLAEALSEYVTSTNPKGLLSTYVLWRMRIDRGRLEATSLTEFNPAEVNEVLLGAMLNPEIRVFQNVYTASKVGKLAKSLTTVFGILELRLLKRLVAVVASEGPYSSAAPIVGVIQSAQFNVVDLQVNPGSTLSTGEEKRQGSKAARLFPQKEPGSTGSTEEEKRQVSEMLQLFPVMPWDTKKDLDAVKIVRRKQLGMQLLATNRGQTTTLPMHHFAKAWAVAANRCDTTFKNAVKNGGDVEEAKAARTVCLAGVAEASQGFMDKVGIPADAQKIFLGAAAEYGKERPKTVTITVTGAMRTAAKKFLAQGDLPPKPTGGAEAAGAAAGAGAASSALTASDTESTLARYRKLLNMGTPLAAVQQSMRLAGVPEDVIVMVDPAYKPAAESAGAGAGVSGSVPAEPKGTQDWSKYERQFKVGLPLQGVLQNMKKDGVSADSIAAFQSKVEKQMTSAGGRCKLVIRTRLTV